MSRLRYVRDPKKTPPARAGLDCTVESLRVVYETNPDIHRALLPRPLVPSAAPEIFIQHANVSMHVSEGNTVTIGAATVGVKCSYEGTEGHYVLAMPMQGEFVVIGGRERFGEPKKIAEVATMERDGSRITTTIGRHGINFLEMSGNIGSEFSVPAPFTEYFFCHKALPRIDGTDGFDGPVFLTRLNWERKYSKLYTVSEPQVVLRESPFDPLVDVPVERITRMQFAVGATNTSGQILAEIPPEYLVNHIHQRYDDGLDVGIHLDESASMVASHG